RRIKLSSADTATPIDRSGGYTASSGITFTQSAPAEPVERIDTSGLPVVGDDATAPRDAPKRTIDGIQLPEPRLEPTEPPPAPIDEIAPVAPDIAPTAPDVAPDIAPTAPDVAPDIAPTAPVAPDIAPIAPDVAPIAPDVGAIAPPEGRL